MGDVITLPRRAHAEIDLPSCGRSWGLGECAHGGQHICWTWRGWPHVCRCLRCHTFPRPATS